MVQRHEKGPNHSFSESQCLRHHLFSCFYTLPTSPSITKVHQYRDRVIFQIRKQQYPISKLFFTSTKVFSATPDAPSNPDSSSFLPLSLETLSPNSIVLQKSPSAKIKRETFPWSKHLPRIQQHEEDTRDKQRPNSWSGCIIK